MRKSARIVLHSVSDLPCKPTRDAAALAALTDLALRRPCCTTLVSAFMTPLERAPQGQSVVARPVVMWSPARTRGPRVPRRTPRPCRRLAAHWEAAAFRHGDADLRPGPAHEPFALVLPAADRDSIIPYDDSEFDGIRWLTETQVLCFRPGLPAALSVILCGAGECGQHGPVDRSALAQCRVRPGQEDGVGAVVACGC